jgi:hypothetical protein
MKRRHFLAAGAASVGAAIAAETQSPFSPQFTGGLRTEDAGTPIEGATWYVADKPGAALTYQFPAGTLAEAKYLTADFLLDGNQMIVFRVLLQEGEDGPVFTFRFLGLNQCSFRVRFPLDLTDQGRWAIDREGAFLKPRVGGARVDPAKVDRMRLEVHVKGTETARWCMTPLRSADGEVPRIDKPLLPKGPLIDEIGQSTLHVWPAKTRDVREVTSRLRSQLAGADTRQWPEGFSRWGGWKDKRLGEGSGFFAVKKDGERWWLVDPDGYAFWSSGMDCVRVDTFASYEGLETALKWIPPREGEFADAHLGRERRTDKQINYLAANCIRAFGADGWRDKWARTALAELRRLRFNTVGNWSEWEFARAAKFPYVRPMSFRAARCGNVYRDFPDVFHSAFEADVAEYAAQLKDTADDPAFLGYFLMNEPTWGFSSELPAAGMLYTSEAPATRLELARFLREKHSSDEALAKAWQMPVTLAQVERGRWRQRLTKAAMPDLEAFSVLMVELYFNTLSRTCKAEDPNHLNLGMRWAGLPPQWAVKGMRSFDVFSINCYRQRVPRDQTDGIHRMLGMPVMVGEWHFGALDVGLPASGIGHLRNQADRAKAYRVYLEDAAANPNCVGVHWFTLYDQSALGRFDGENYNIGFLDVCNRPYEELGEAAKLSHERMYTVAAGRTAAYDEKLEYLPNLF